MVSCRYNLHHHAWRDCALQAKFFLGVEEILFGEYKKYRKSSVLTALEQLNSALCCGRSLN